MIGTGDRIGRYTLGRRLGPNSGQGSVFLAADDRDFQVALKVPHQQSQRFARELDAARAVVSPYVARVWDFDLQSDPPFIAYEVVPGEPLDHVLNRRSLSVSELLSVFTDVARGLAAIHAVTTAAIPLLSHGDLSLDNIMVTDRNTAVLIDLGAARTGNDSSLSRDLFGKFGYFAPEQLLGGTGGPPGDMWQLGVCMVRATTLHMPFGTGPESTLRILEAAPNVADLPHEFANVVAKCLIKDPVSRPAASEAASLIAEAATLYEPPLMPECPAVVWEGHRTVQRVTALSFKLDGNGVVQRHGSIDDPPFPNYWRWSVMGPEVAVGDFVAVPSLSAGVFAPVGFRPLNRSEVTAPNNCHSCNMRLLDTTDTWRAVTIAKWASSINERLYCPNAGHCLEQDSTFWHKFIVTTRLNALGRAWRTLAELDIAPAHLLSFSYAQFAALSNGEKEPWLKFADQRQRFADQQNRSVGMLLLAFSSPPFPFLPELVATPRGAHIPGLQALLAGAFPYPRCTPELLPAAQTWWSERHTAVLDVAATLLTYTTPGPKGR